MTANDIASIIYRHGELLAFSSMQQAPSEEAFRKMGGSSGDDAKDPA